MKKQAGFSLVELMVGMGVTMVVLLAATAMFTGAARTNSIVSLGSDMNENLRAGMNLMVQDLIQTGTQIDTGGISIPHNSAGAFLPINRPSPPGTANTFPIGYTVLNAIEPGNGLGPTVASPDGLVNPPSDIITLLYADNTLALDNDPVNGAGCLAGSINSAFTTVTFDPNCINLTVAGPNLIRINPGDLIEFYSTTGNCIQTVSSVAGQVLTFTGGDAFNLNGRTDTDGRCTNLKVGGVYPPISARRIWMVTYYLDNVTDPQNVRLVRQVNFNPGQAVGEVFESLQFLYNFVDGGTNPANQPSIPAGNSESQIKSVNVMAGTRTTSLPVGRKNYTHFSLMTQVCLRSMAYVDRYR